MLVAELIVDCVYSKHRNLELLCRCVRDRCGDIGLIPTETEIKVVLERLINNKTIGVYQYLAEDHRYDPIEYRRSYAYFYWFGPPSQSNRLQQSRPHNEA